MPTTWILLRGLVREQAHWNGFADRLAGALGADHRVMCMDLPGNGLRHRDRSPTRIAAMVDAAREDLAGRGVDGPIHLVGCPWAAWWRWIGCNVIRGRWPPPP